MTQVPMLPPGMIQEPANLVKRMSLLTSCKAQLAQEIILVPSQPASHREAWPVCSDGQLNGQISSEWPENTDSLDMMPERCRPLKMSQGIKKA